MKDNAGKITYKEKEYKVVFNLNVMEAIQEEFGTLDKWTELTSGTNQEVNVVGRNKMLEQPEFSSNIEKIKSVFNKLEDKEIIHNIEEDEVFSEYFVQRNNN